MGAKKRHNCSTCKKAGRRRAARPGQWTCKQCHQEYMAAKRLDRAINWLQTPLPRAADRAQPAAIAKTTSAKRRRPALWSGSAERDRRPWRQTWRAQKLKIVAPSKPGRPSFWQQNSNKVRYDPCSHVIANRTFRRVLETRTTKGFYNPTGRLQDAKFGKYVRRRCECTQCGHRWSEFREVPKSAEQLSLAS